MISRLPRPAELRAAFWAARALRATRRSLAGGTVRRVPMRHPPDLPTSAIRGVEALLRRRRHTCLEAALIRQCWLAEHGVLSDVVIGVTPLAAGFEAHAWLEPAGRPVGIPKFFEITRLAPSNSH